MKKDRLITQFVQYLEVELNASPRTVVAYSAALYKFQRFHGPYIRWRTSDPRQFRAFLSHCMQLELSRSYVRGIFSALRSFYEFLIEREDFAENPLKDIRLPKLEKKLPLVLSVSQVEELLKAPLKARRESQAPAWAGDRDAAILELLYSSGLRLAELVALDVANLDLLEQTVRMVGKGEKDRIAPVGGAAMRALEQYCSQAGVTTGPLFISKLRRRISKHSVRLLLRKHLSSTSIRLKVSPHTLRHCFATHLLDAGANLVSVKEMLGHEKLSTTAIYTHISMERLRKAYDEANPGRGTRPSVHATANT
jgi:integrase/recombinase XerC